MRQELKKFTEDDEAAVTVDWVVLTAAIVGIALIVIGIIEGGLISAANAIAGAL